MKAIATIAQEINAAAVDYRMRDFQNLDSRSKGHRDTSRLFNLNPASFVNV
jgi:hypothetical protein